jgi:hypothetical protein
MHNGPKDKTNTCKQQTVKEFKQIMAVITVKVERLMRRKCSA